MQENRRKQNWAWLHAMQAVPIHVLSALLKQDSIKYIPCTQEAGTCGDAASKGVHAAQKPSLQTSMLLCQLPRAYHKAAY